MRAFYSGAAPLPGFSQKTHAAHRVWKGSTRSEVKSAPMPKDEAVRIFHDLRRMERRTRGSFTDPRGRVSRQDGALGRTGLLVMHTLLFDFLNYKSGRLDPSYESIAAKASLSVRSVARALVRLKAAKVLNWVHRCYVAAGPDGGFLLKQDSNAYGITRPPAPPAPDPDTWGKPPGRPRFGAAVDELAAGNHRAAHAAMSADPGDGLAQAVARLYGRDKGLLL